MWLLKIGANFNSAACDIAAHIKAAQNKGERFIQKLLRLEIKQRT